jgi:5-methylcytosine-specific restriction endonuclease McrA
MAMAEGYHCFNGRNEFAARYQKYISSGEWKRRKLKIIEQRGNQCERCKLVGVSIEVHHVHYRSLGNEKPEDFELLCRECHAAADEARAAKGRPRRAEPPEDDSDPWL